MMSDVNCTMIHLFTVHLKAVKPNKDINCVCCSTAGFLKLGVANGVARVWGREINHDVLFKFYSLTTVSI